MEMGTCRWREVVIDCLAYQGVPEPGPPGLIAAEQVRAEQGLDDIRRLLGRQIGHRCGDGGPEPRAEHTGRAHVSLRDRISSGEPGQQQPPDRLAPRFVSWA